MGNWTQVFRVTVSDIDHYAIKDLIYKVLIIWYLTRLKKYKSEKLKTENKRILQAKTFFFEQIFLS